MAMLINVPFCWCYSSLFCINMLMNVSVLFIEMLLKNQLFVICFIVFFCINHTNSFCCTHVLVG